MATDSSIRDPTLVEFRADKGICYDCGTKVYDRGDQSDPNVRCWIGCNEEGVVLRGRCLRCHPLPQPVVRADLVPSTASAVTPEAQAPDAAAAPPAAASSATGTTRSTEEPNGSLQVPAAAMHPTEDMGANDLEGVQPSCESSIDTSAEEGEEKDDCNDSDEDYQEGEDEEEDEDLISTEQIETEPTADSPEQVTSSGEGEADPMLEAEPLDDSPDEVTSGPAIAEAEATPMIEAADETMANPLNDEAPPASAGVADAAPANTAVATPANTAMEEEGPPVVTPAAAIATSAAQAPQSDEESEGEEIQVRDGDGGVYTGRVTNPGQGFFERVEQEGEYKGKVSKYVGQFQNGLMHGRGKCTHASGSVYIGDFVEGFAHGRGVNLWPDWTYRGEWVRDERYGRGTQRQNQPNGEVYSGQWKDDAWHGQGNLKFAGGGSYSGSFQNGMLHGNGVYEFVDGSVYKGSFKHDLRSGRGEMTYADKSVYVGQWKDNCCNGQGRLTMPDKSFFEGTFKNDEKVKGIFYRPDGSRAEETWSNGKLVASKPI